MTPHLDRLAEYVGILPSYVGYDGKPKETPTDTKRALLGVMGLGGAASR